VSLEQRVPQDRPSLAVHKLTDGCKNCRHRPKVAGAPSNYMHKFRVTIGDVGPSMRFSKEPRFARSKDRTIDAHSVVRLRVEAVPPPSALAIEPNAIEPNTVEVWCQFAPTVPVLPALPAGKSLSSLASGQNSPWHGRGPRFDPDQVSQLRSSPWRQLGQFRTLEHGATLLFHAACLDAMRVVAADESIRHLQLLHQGQQLLGASAVLLSSSDRRTKLRVARAFLQRIDLHRGRQADG